MASFFVATKALFFVFVRIELCNFHWFEHELELQGVREELAVCDRAENKPEHISHQVYEPPTGAFTH